MPESHQRPVALLPEFRFVTGNRSKLEEAGRILGFVPPSVTLDLPEIQSLDLLEVLRAKADAAARSVEGSIVVEETGLALSCLNGFPGPLVKWLLEAVGHEGVAELALSRGDARATAECAILFRPAGTRSGEDVVAWGKCPGTLVLPPRGTNGFGWDPVFQPDGERATCAQLGDAIKDRIGHRGRAWRALVAALARGQVSGCR